MKKVLWLLVLMGLILAGCSEDGTLRITNFSNYSAWFQVGSGGYTTLNSGQMYEKDYSLSKSIFGDEDKRVTVNYGGEFVFTNSVSKTIKPGSTARVDIFSDAGVIRIENETFYDITEVYLAPSDDLYWGSNDLSGTIGYNEYVEWLVSPGYWDVMFYATDGNYYEINNINMTTEFTYTITFEYGMRGITFDAQKKEQNAQNSRTITKDKCEQTKVGNIEK